MFYLSKSPVHGQGVFSRDDIPYAEAFECPILVLDNKEIKAITFTCLSNKLFQWGEEAGVVLSPLCMANHSKNPNMGYTPSSVGAVMIFYALRDIPAGEEILINYKDFAKVLGLD